jgi:hypothetical protein
MIGGNPLRVAKNHGHGVQTMLEVYAAWIDGAKGSDVEAIKAAMAGSPRARSEFGTDLALHPGTAEPSEIPTEMARSALSTV